MAFTLGTGNIEASPSNMALILDKLARHPEAHRFDGDPETDEPASVFLSVGVEGIWLEFSADGHIEFGEPAA